MRDYIVLRSFWLGGRLYRVGDKVSLCPTMGRLFEADFKVEEAEARKARRR